MNEDINNAPFDMANLLQSIDSQSKKEKNNKLSSINDKEESFPSRSIDNLTSAQQKKNQETIEQNLR